MRLPDLLHHLPDLIPLQPGNTDLGAAHTIRAHYIEALVRNFSSHPDPEVLPLFQQVICCPWAEVWEGSFTRLMHPSDSGARAFLKGFLRLKREMEQSIRPD